MIIRSGSDLEALIRPSALRACIQEHLRGVPQMERLRGYYRGQHDVLGRERASGLPNNRLVHSFPRYISTLAAGYLVGNPVQYDADETQRDALEAVTDCYVRCAADSVDAELARCASVLGKGVERVFADAEALPRTAALDPARAFVVYDDSVENRPLMGVYLSPVLREDGAEEGWTTEVCTAAETIRFRSGAPGDIGSMLSRQAHFFGGVPMIEYWNGEDERGDFEGVLTLIDAYDRLQSDRLNDKQQFVDALLLLYGCTMETDARGRQPGQQLREDKVLVLPDADAHAEWLYKQLSETDTEVLKRALSADIHKLSMVPDLSDERFGTNVSGVAMRYKLLGLEQLTRVKERWFREALRQRLKLFAKFLEVRGGKPLDVDRVRMTFTRSLPADDLDQARAIQALAGVVPEDVLRQRAMRMDGMN